MPVATDRSSSQPRAGRILKVTLPILITLLPLLIGSIVFWVRSTPLRRELRIGASLAGGRHNEIAGRLVEDLSGKGGLSRLESVRTQGSLENLRLLQMDEVHFALYQAGTLDELGPLEFESLDRDPVDSLLSIDEFRRGTWFSHWEQDALPKTALRFFRRLDLNGDERLSLAEFNNADDLRFVANLYSEVVHLIVRNDSAIESLGDLPGKCVALGRFHSGDFAASRILLRYHGIDLDVDLQRFHGDLDGAAAGDADRSGEGADEDYYQRVAAGFRSGTLDAAIITIGLHAERIEWLMRDLQGTIRLLSIDHTAGLASREILLSPTVIPGGAYDGQLADTHTVQLMAQLLSRADVDPEVVERFARRLLDDGFEREAHLNELYFSSPTTRVEFARRRPEFALHQGARLVYSAEQFDMEEFQNLEALYSLTASLLLGLFFGGRWLAQRRVRQLERLRERQMRAQKEELDRFLERTIQIERAQMNETRIDRLEQYLDEVTQIKLEALNELTHEDLRGDRTFSIFLMQCANLISKIQMKVLMYSQSVPSEK